MFSVHYPSVLCAQGSLVSPLSSSPFVSLRPPSHSPNTNELLIEYFLIFAQTEARSPSQNKINKKGTTRKTNSKQAKISEKKHYIKSYDSEPRQRSGVRSVRRGAIQLSPFSSPPLPFPPPFPPAHLSGSVSLFGSCTQNISARFLLRIVVCTLHTAHVHTPTLTHTHNVKLSAPRATTQHCTFFECIPLRFRHWTALH